MNVNMCVFQNTRKKYVGHVPNYSPVAVPMKKISVLPSFVIYLLLQLKNYFSLVRTLKNMARG